MIKETAVPYQTAILKTTKVGGQPNKEFEQKLMVKMTRSIDERFDKEELRSLCFELGLSYESLTGEGKESKARELVTYFHRRGRVGELIAFVKQARPNVDWDEILN